MSGDEIIVAGQRVHTGTRVITWRDSGGYDAYIGLPPLVPRELPLGETEKQRVRPFGWDLPALQKVVDQFVLHYDACGLSKVCFAALRARRLSVHFLLDVDGTVYQTLDLQERALHATTSNDRSIGIEIANIGAFPPDAAQPLEHWYRRETDGDTTLTIPAGIGNSGIATPHFNGRPARRAPVRGVIQDRMLLQYDFTPEQYAALTHKLSDRELAPYRGILGHYHIQENKVDPGPAFDWERFIRDVRRATK